MYKKEYLETIIVISFFLLLVFIVPGCVSEQRRMDNTNEVLQISNQQEKSEHEKEVESFNIKLEELTSLLDGIDDIDDKHIDNIDKLIVKFNSEYDLERKIKYSEMLINNFNEYIGDFANFYNLEVKIQGLNFFEDACKYKLEYLMERTLFFIYFNNLENESKLEEAEKSVIESFNYYQIEVEEIKKLYNAEAEKLGLLKPFQ
jgi:hypothetical protein